MYIVLQHFILVSTSEVISMEYLGDTHEDAYLLLDEWKELPRHDWIEYWARPSHTHEIYPLISYKQEEECFLWAFV